MKVKEKKDYKSLLGGSTIRFIELFLDMIFVVISLFIVVQFKSLIVDHRWLGIEEFFTEYSYESYIALGVYVVVCGIFFIIYKTSVVRRTLMSNASGILLALLFSNLFLLLMSVIFSTDFLFSPPYIAFIVLFLQALLFIPYKWLLSKIFVPVNKRKVLIFGPKEEADSLLKEFLNDNNSLIRVKYIVYYDPDVDLTDKLEKYISEVDDVYITDNIRYTLKNQIAHMVSFDNKKDLYIVPRTYEILMMNAKYDQVEDSLVFRISDMNLSLEQRFYKRTIDLIIAILGLIIASIPMLVIALIIKLQDGGPVFYKQKRFKRNKAEFNILKFRSMKFNQTKEEEQVLATAHDPRITKFGRLIRATRLDELPQLINVLKGDMSLVGPRPIMESAMEDGDLVSGDFKYRSNVKPGVTGLAQICGRNDTSNKDRIRFDLLYIRKFSLLLDFKIMFLTVKTMLSKTSGLGKDTDYTIEELLTKYNKKTEEVLKDKVYRIVKKDESKN